jgi:hypothetical protein
MSANVLRRAALAATLGLGVWAGLARAGDYKVPPAATEMPPAATIAAKQEDQCHHPLWNWLWHRRRLGCWASFNGYSCGSLESECAFVFGSCRTFFGEPCLKQPPPSPLPPWVNLNPPTGNGAANGHGNGGGCGCP